MRLIVFLIMILNLNLFSEEIPQFRNKIAINGSTVILANKNGALDIISFAKKTGEDYIINYKPVTNILYFNKIDRHSTNIIYYYSIFTNKENHLDSKYHTYIIQDDLLFDLKDIDTPKTGTKPKAILIDYNKYGKKYLKSLFEKDLFDYSPSDFEGKFVSLDGKSFFVLKNIGKNSFYIKGQTPTHFIEAIDNNKENKVKLNLTNKAISINFNYGYSSLEINILDNNTLIVLETSPYDVVGLKGVYTRVR